MLAPGWHKLRGDGKESGESAGNRNSIIDRDAGGLPNRYLYWARIGVDGLVCALAASRPASGRNEEENRDFIARAEAAWGCSILSLIGPPVDDWATELIVRL